MPDNKEVSSAIVLIQRRTAVSKLADWSV